jgi:hypothetical protein
MANYPWAGYVLFDGRGYSAPDLPWYYASWWLLISTPPVVLAGALLSLLRAIDRVRTIRVCALWVVAALPFSMVVARDSTVYDGIRHLLFTYPVLVVLAASGWAGWLSARNPSVRRVIAIVLAAGLFNILAFNVRAYPNQAVYFNEVAGGPRGAFARYELDYWGNCVLQAVAWSADIARLSGRPITVSGNPWHLVQLNSERFRELSFTPREGGQHYLEIRLNRGSQEGVIELANNSQALYRVQTPDGAVLCVVLPGPAFGQLEPYLTLPPEQSARHLPR